MGGGWVRGRQAVIVITVARKPIIGSVAANALCHGTSGLNIDGCRIATANAEDDRRLREAPRPNVPATFAGWLSVSGSGKFGRDSYSPKGRWPANVIFCHKPGCSTNGCVSGCSLSYLDQQGGFLHSRGNIKASVTIKPEYVDFYIYGHFKFGVERGFSYDHGGGASRFFKQVGGRR